MHSGTYSKTFLESSWFIRSNFETVGTRRGHINSTSYIQITILYNRIPTKMPTIHHERTAVYPLLPWFAGILHTGTKWFETIHQGYVRQVEAHLAMCGVAWLGLLFSAALQHHLNIRVTQHMWVTAVDISPNFSSFHYLRVNSATTRVKKTKSGISSQSSRSVRSSYDRKPGGRPGLWLKV